MASVVPDLNYADIKEVECALPAQPELSCRYQIRIGGKVLGTARGGEGGRTKHKGEECSRTGFISLNPTLRS